MSYYVNINESDIFINAKMKNQINKGFQKSDIKEFNKYKTFEDFFENELKWKFNCDEKGNIINIEHLEKRYDEDKLIDSLNIVAPYVENGEISFTGEDDERWSFVFKDGELNIVPIYSVKAINVIPGELILVKWKVIELKIEEKDFKNYIFPNLTAGEIIELYNELY